MRDLLVRATAIGDRDAAVHDAAQLAAHLRATLTAVFVVPAGMPPLPSYDIGLLAAQYLAELDQQTREAQAAAAGFSAWASSMGVAHPAWLACAGHVADVLTHAGLWHDLLVLPLDRDGGDPWATAAGVGRLVLQARLPCLVLPAGAPVPPRFDHVAVAWDGSAEAIRALHAALPLLERARRVVFLVGKRKPQSAALPEFRLEAWVERHLQHAAFSALDPGEAGPRILLGAREAGAELLVMGAYGHARVTEWILGGATRHALEHARLPLFMAH